ncbi:MAG TPA: hypothetical protein VGK67_05515 [Myxococcales bacterium]|jgi:hypothetical protein
MPRWDRSTLGVIATLPPYVDHRQEIIDHPQVDALRFNTISPLGGSRSQILERLQRECGDKRLWLDLKGRQLRIAKFAYLPYAFVELNHRIQVDLPVDVHFKDCVSRAVELVDGNKLILNRRPVRVVGEGEPINILDPALKIEGSLTDGDREYVEAARKLGLHDFMLSFVERREDVEELLELDPEANVIAKIESRKGLDFVRNDYPALKDKVVLMAARDDLFINLGEAKEEMLEALELLVASDPDAIAASRLLCSLEESGQVAAQDLSDLWLLLKLGFKNFMLSDGLCFREEAFRSAVGVLDRVLGAPSEAGE